MASLTTFTKDGVIYQVNPDMTISEAVMPSGVVRLKELQPFLPVGSKVWVLATIEKNIDAGILVGIASGTRGILVGETIAMKPYAGETEGGANG